MFSTYINIFLRILFSEVSSSLWKRIMGSVLSKVLLNDLKVSVIYPCKLLLLSMKFMAHTAFCQ